MRFSAISFTAMALGLLGAALPRVGDAAAETRSHAASGSASHGASGGGSCRPQKAQPFLKRSNFVKKGQLRGREHQRALRWRAETYGSVTGLETYNSQSADASAASTRFMGLPLSVHKKIVPAVHCVEHRIRATCTKKGTRYTAHAVGGFRQDNTYRKGEVSNHLFGIAIDIDPDKNPCCGCVDPWPNHPLCKSEASSVFEKTALPRCWIDAFERYGFYWLGRDELQDTMHFEYLGNPERIAPRG
jgi:hypothetical protein